MRRIKINEDFVLMADRWSEVTLGQLFKIENGDSQDVVFLFSVLTGIEYKVIINSSLTEDELYESVEFIYSGAPDWIKLKVPSHLIIGGKLCKVPRVDKVCLGQSILASQLYEKPLSEVFIKVMAMYFQPLVDGGKFDRDRVNEVEKMLANVPAVEGWPVGNFFILSKPSLKRIMAQGFLQVRKIP